MLKYPTRTNEPNTMGLKNVFKFWSNLSENSPVKSTFSFHMAPWFIFSYVNYYRPKIFMNHTVKDKGSKTFECGDDFIIVFEYFRKPI
jgi:hypothetical protein